MSRAGSSVGGGSPPSMEGDGMGRGGGVKGGGVEE